MRLVYAVLFLACLPYDSYGWSLNPFAKKNNEEKSLRGPSSEEPDEDFDEIEKDIVEAEADQQDASILLDEVIADEVEEEEEKEEEKEQASDEDTEEASTEDDTEPEGKALGHGKKEPTDGGVGDAAADDEEKTPNGVAKGYDDAPGQNKEDEELEAEDTNVVEVVEDEADGKAPNGIAKEYHDASGQTSEDEELDAELAAVTAELEATTAEIEKAEREKNGQGDGSTKKVIGYEEKAAGEKAPNGMAKGYDDPPGQTSEDEELDAELAAVTAELEATTAEIEKAEREKNGQGDGSTKKATGDYAVSTSSARPARKKEGK